MKKGWEIKKLGDLGKVSMCKRILKKQTTSTGYIPFYKIGTFGKAPNAFISKEVYEEYRSKYSFPKKGDILLSASGTIGRRVIYDGKPAYFQDSNIVWIDNNEKEVLNEYLYKFYGFCDWNPSKGATISRLYNDDLRRIEIPYPKSLPEQQRIVAILDKAFTAIATAKENAQQNLLNAKELFESYLQNVFDPSTRSGQEGDDWEEKTLGDVVNFFNGFAFKSKDAIDNSNTQVIRMGNLYQNKLNLDRKAVFYPNSFAIDYEKYLLKENDLIISLTGTTGKEDYGYTVKIPQTERNLLLNQRIAKFEIKDEKIIERDLLFQFLLSRVFLDELYKTANGTRQANLSTETMKGLEISFPKSLKKQQQIVKNLNSLSVETKKLEAIYQQKINDLEELKKSVLEKAFNGELTQKETV